MDKINAIKYIILQVAKEFNKYNSMPENDVTYFNKHNNFSLLKCLMLPYIITIANGKKNFFLLEGIFENSFFPIISKNIEKVVIGHLEDEFLFYNETNLELEFNNDGNLILNNNDLSSQDNFNLDSKLVYNINYSIQFFIARRYNDFAVLTSTTLAKLTTQNSAFEVIQNFIMSRNIDDNKLIVQLFNIVASQSIYFTSYNDNIEETFELNDSYAK
ncbi:hypothetical protein [Chryseobacterium sp. BIGb0232]|uniref:hypothetical protein n=1 Tax=Chryseobacterium sp. BIGb0232 TaxID=2940598 RepID=UPI000F484654|nr:hypothetical protein [Chryseobacterium sp. BIGb0232]MCS4304570.1 hypothetical protein [Chryseobacterium sp. BIGb0232]ROS14296.1 hypothetical protein EDF65_3067 [Chryseobacterium nakagawai]